MNSNIQLIVGLGNPGKKYHNTRHNAGAWFVQKIAEDTKSALQNESKFQGAVGVLEKDGTPCRLLIPSTFMNLSGQSVKALAHFYKIPPEAILIAHDELDFEPGVTKLKWGGGHGGHNGLRDTIEHLGTSDFWRLRIGIGHPGNRDEVSDYVLCSPPENECEKITKTIHHAIMQLPLLLKGQFQIAMNHLNLREQHGL